MSLKLVFLFSLWTVGDGGWRPKVCFLFLVLQVKEHSRQYSFYFHMMIIVIIISGFKSGEFNLANLSYWHVIISSLDLLIFASCCINRLCNKWDNGQPSHELNSNTSKRWFQTNTYHFLLMQHRRILMVIFEVRSTVRTITRVSVCSGCWSCLNHEEQYLIKECIHRYSEWIIWEVVD